MEKVEEKEKEEEGAWSPLSGLRINAVARVGGREHAVPNAMTEGRVGGGEGPYRSVGVTAGNKGQAVH